MKYVLVVTSKVVGTLREIRDINNQQDLDNMIDYAKKLPQDRYFGTTCYIQSEDGSYFNQIM